jgi:hypothetical protein
MINIEKAFVTENRSVFDFFQQPGMGFYIPLYQREYSWDSDNIDQLLEDISKGIERLAEGIDDDEIRFLGTIITVAEINKNNIQPQDTQALPARIDKLIDGQQRLSTISIFATLLYKQLTLISKKIKTTEPLNDEILEICENWKEKLIVIFSLDLGRGTPRRKPKIIRGQKDKWTRDGQVNDNYFSPIANYLGSFITAITNDSEYPVLDKEKLGQNIVQNIKSIDNWLKNKVIEAHRINNDDFIQSWKILEHIDEEHIWLYERPHLKDLVNQQETTDKKSVSYIISELVQLFSVCHYLTERCCFTIIQPSNDDWAFDMFQSLNATGTPLTAIETFKPAVVIETQEGETDFKGSANERGFAKVEELFKRSVTAQQKSKLTNDFLTSFAISYDGSKLSSHFSHQRKWLDRRFKDLTNYNKKTEFIGFFGDYAEFYRVGLNEYDGKNLQTLPLINNSQDAELSSLLVLFLKESNHKMAWTILGHFYKEVINGSQNSIQDFIEVSKAIAAFYGIWRSARNNSGLDNVYRDFFKGESKSWLNRKKITVQEVKEHLNGALIHAEINERSIWLQRAFVELKYNKSTSVCKLALFISAHDTIPDPQVKGLVKFGVKGSINYLNFARWNSSDLSTIEHIAPIKNDGSWDNRLYNIENELFQSIGNLTLLPPDINTSAGNRGWKEKYLYYRHLAEKDPVVLQELANKASSNGITLSSATIQKLQESTYNDHISSIVTLDDTDNWDSVFVELRAKRILEIFWDKISLWLE